MSEIKPALTPEEWASHEATPRMADGVAILHAAARVADDYAHQRDATANRTKTAALALHGHPRGFTWDDVASLRGQAKLHEHDGREATALGLRSLADRIEALLPPRETAPLG